MLRKISIILLFITIAIAGYIADTPSIEAAELQQTVPAELLYGFTQDPTDPQRLIAIASPNVNANDVTISTATFAFLLPAGTVTEPEIPVAPDSGSFVNITGNWSAIKITPSLYASIGFNPEVLDGYDLYQVVLSPGSASPVLRAGQPLPLFSFQMPQDCNGNSVQVLENDSAIQQTLLATLGANFNNQMSISINDMPTTNLYVGNNPGGSSVSCPIGAVELPTHFYLPLINKNW